MITSKPASVCIVYKPGPPRFAWSTFLVISSPNFVKLALAKFWLAIKLTATNESVLIVSRVRLGGLSA